MASTLGSRLKWKFRWVVPILVCLVSAFMLVSADRNLVGKGSDDLMGGSKIGSYLWPPPGSKYQPVWPELKFGWMELLGTFVGFIGAALGSVGGVGGGAIFVPMLTVIIGFDVKSATAISKCMITGIASASVFSKLKMRHPTLDIQLIDYDLALLFQPMLLLGIVIGVYLNVIFADWMIILILILLSLGTASRAFFSGFDTWRKETLIMREMAADPFSDDETMEVVQKPLLGSSSTAKTEPILVVKSEVPVHQNIHWKDLGLLIVVWIAFVVIQIIKNSTTTCSIEYWLLNFLQIPVAGAVTLYESISLYRGKRVIASKEEQGIDWSVHLLVLYSICGIFAGIVGGFLGLGGSFILAPLLLELGIPPQVSSATATFVMAFSAPLSVVQYYLLERFPLSYAIYFVMVALIATLVGQRLVRKVIVLLGRASLIIFILAFVIAVSAISLGVHGIINLVHSIRQGDYIGFEDRCLY